MNNLVLFDQNGRPFSCEEVREALEAIPGTYNLREGKFIGAVMDCEYDFEGASTIIRLADNLESIDLTGVSPASLNAAIQLQRLLKRHVRPFDLAYTFDIVLDEASA